jgi:hypothetical protein
VEGARRAREQRRAQLDASVARARTIARAKWEAERPIVLAELKHNRPSRPKVGEEALQRAKERARNWWERGNGSPQRQRQPEREWRVPPRSPAAAQAAAAAAAATATATAGSPHVGDERMLRGGAGVDGSVSARVPSGPPSEASQRPTSHSDAAMDAMRAELESTQELVRRMEQRLLQSEMRRLHPSGTMAPGTAAAGDVPAPAMTTGGTGTWSSSPSTTPQHATPVMAATAHRVDGARSSSPPSSSTTSPPPLSQPQRPAWGICVATDLGTIASASTSTSTSTIQEGAAAPLGVPLVPTPRTRSNDGATAKEASLLPPTRAAVVAAAAATAATCDDATDTASPGRLGARSARRKVDVPSP